MQPEVFLQGHRETRKPASAIEPQTTCRIRRHYAATTAGTESARVKAVSEMPLRAFLRTSENRRQQLNPIPLPNDRIAVDWDEFKGNCI
jgi:hypothetical protein